MATKEKVRVAFEAWHRDHCGHLAHEDGFGGYEGALPQARWEAWQAAFPNLPDSSLDAERLPGADTDPPRKRVEGDFLLRDWVIERYGPDRIRVCTPPLRGGVRESHMAHRDSLEGDGFFMLANAMLASGCSADEAPRTDTPLPGVVSAAEV